MYEMINSRFRSHFSQPQLLQNSQMSSDLKFIQDWLASNSTKKSQKDLFYSLVPGCLSNAYKKSDLVSVSPIPSVNPKCVPATAATVAPSAEVKKELKKQDKSPRKPKEKKTKKVKLDEKVIDIDTLETSETQVGITYEKEGSEEQISVDQDFEKYFDDFYEKLDQEIREKIDAIPQEYSYEGEGTPEQEREYILFTSEIKIDDIVMYGELFNELYTELMKDGPLPNFNQRFISARESWHVSLLVMDMYRSKWFQ